MEVGVMYTMMESLGWSFPDDFLTTGYVEDNDTGDTEDFECILVDKVVEIATRIWRKELVTETGEWVDKVREAVEDADAEQWMTNMDVIDSIQYWVESELNTEMEKDAQALLDSKLDGSYWDGEY